MPKSTSTTTTVETKPEIVEKTVEESSGDSDDSSVVSDSSDEESSEEVSTELKPSSEKEALSKEDDSSDDVYSSGDSSDEELPVNEEDDTSEEKSSNEEKSSDEEESSNKETSSIEKSTTDKATSAKVQKRSAPNEEESPKKLSKLNDGSANVVKGVENTVYVGQMLLDATVEDIKKFFSDCGEIVDIRLGTSPDGGSRGYCYIDFSDAEGKTNAKKLNGSELMGRPIKVADATPPRDKTEEFIKKTDTVFVGNLNHSMTQDSVREVFKKFGTIREISVPEGKKSGKKPCIAFIRYNNRKQAANAIREMTGVTVEGRVLRLNFAENKKLSGGKRGNKKKSA